MVKGPNLKFKLLVRILFLIGTPCLCRITFTKIFSSPIILLENEDTREEIHGLQNVIYYLLSYFFFPFSFLRILILFYNSMNEGERRIAPASFSILTF